MIKGTNLTVSGFFYQVAGGIRCGGALKVVFAIEGNCCYDALFDKRLFFMRIFTFFTSVFLTLVALNLYALPAGLSNLSSSKKAFFEKIYQPAKVQNDKILEDRALVQKAFSDWQSGTKLSLAKMNQLNQIKNRYGFKGELNTKANFQNLLARVDLIPLSMVLAQAANESAWGNSRFAKNGNNLFGEWCFTKGCGITPLARPKNATYEVRAFPSMGASIQSYMNNLNTHRAYESFRQLRLKARENHQALKGEQLAMGLLAYSSRGQAYVKNIQSMILQNHLQTLD